MSILSLVLAMSDNGVIGAGGSIPWHVPEDMRRFKAITLGKPVIMGRKTWESLPKRPLVGRTNIVITRDKAFAADGALVANSLEGAVTAAERENPSEVMVIGGAEIYRLALPLAARVHLTEVHRDFEGDARLPRFEVSLWRETGREDHATKDGLRYTYVTLERR